MGRVSGGRKQGVDEWSPAPIVRRPLAGREADRAGKSGVDFPWRENRIPGPRESGFDLYNLWFLLEL